MNRAMGAQIAAEKAAMRPKRSVKWLAEHTDLSESTINRILSEDPRDIHVTAIARLATVFGITPQELVKRAVERAGGMSDGGATVIPFRPKQSPEDGAQKDIDERQPHAANFDLEHEQDEPDPA